MNASTSQSQPIAAAAGPAGASAASLRGAARLAAAGAVLTTLLITVGGLVTNTDSGLACPDWPTCFGTPFPKLVGGVLMEHGHRYLATAVGFVAVLCVWLSARGAPRLAALFLAMPLILGGATWAGIARHQTGAVPAAAGALVLLGYLAGAAAAARSRGGARLAQVALLLVITQGLLGGLTVMYQLPVTVLVLHTGTSMIFLSTLIWLAVRLGDEAARAGAAGAGGEAPAAGPPRGAAAGTAGGAGLLPLAAGAVYLQILIGATVRHTNAGLICTDLPWCVGALWPVHVHPAVHLHMVHRSFALVAGGLAAAAGLQAARAALASGDRVARRIALALPALVLLQLTLGVLTIWSLKELWTVTAHLLGAALLLGGCVALWARARLGAASRAPGGLAAAPAIGSGAITGGALSAQGRSA